MTAPRIVVVGMAQLAVVKSPDLIQTQALGSCVGVVLLDQQTKVGGIAHAMLPSIDRSRMSSKDQLAKFVDSAIDHLLEKMAAAGALKRMIKAKLAGGANMFPDIARRSVEHIGLQNVTAAKRKLSELGIPLVGEDTGGTSGRTVTLDTSTWKLKVKSALMPEKFI